MSGIDWDEAFANAAYIPGGAQYPDAWAEAARQFRTQAGGALALAYAAHPRARLDLFQPPGPARGLVVFVHGGYWLKFDKSYWSHLAAGPVARGWAVAVPSYPLAPEVTLSEITAAVGQAVAFAAREVAGPIRLAGHSAGGHLVTRLICADSPLAPEIRNRIAHVISISGLHDLRPLLATQMNAELRLTRESAVAESPALRAPLSGIPVTVWVGVDERPEFLRQAALLREAWAGQGAEVALITAPNAHHFDVIAPLQIPESALSRVLLGG